MSQNEPVKLYFDFKSPYSYLACDPALELPERYDIELRWIPYSIQIPDISERGKLDARRVRYLYMDARRWANRQGGLVIKGPKKIYDSRPALIGSLFADQQGFHAAFVRCVFRRFFERALEIDEPQAIAEVVGELGGDPELFLRYLNTEGMAHFEQGMAESDKDEIFGIPSFVLRGEVFWGRDRISLLEERLTELGLKRDPAP